MVTRGIESVESEREKGESRFEGGLQRDGLRSGAASPPAEEGEARFCRLRGGTELQLGRRWSWRAGTRTSNQWLADGPRPRQGKGGEGKGEAEGEREEGELDRGLEAGHGESRCDTSERGSGDVGEEGLTSNRTSHRANHHQTLQWARSGNLVASGRVVWRGREGR